MGVPDELFLNLFCRTAYQLLEQPQGRGRMGPLLSLIAEPLRLAPGMEATVVATVMHLVGSHEHAVGPVAELCRITRATDARESREAREEGGPVAQAAGQGAQGAGLAVAVLREAARVDVASKGPGAKHVGLLLVELSEALPALVFAQVPPTERIPRVAPNPHTHPSRF